MSSSDDGSDFEIIGQALNTKKQPTAYGSRANKAPAASSSRSTLAQRSAEPSRTAARTERTVVVDEETGAQIREIDDELASIHEQIQALLVLEDELKEKRTTLLNLAKSSKSRAAPSAPVRPAPSASASRDYTRSDFDWSKLLKARLKEVWGYSKFRFCQEAVCNAALDGRDAVIIMPTGSGKSICYQLPALLSEGLTVVVSPLISLMLDQVLNLREVDVEAEHLSAAVPRQETAEILKGIREGTSTIKLLYVTPERVAKSKTLMSALQKAYERGNLSHIVIDEAHCAASMGHDYRPDYKGLSIFRKVFPDVPLQMLTATCGPKVLDQVIQIMGIKPTTSPNAAAPNRTLLFQAPLYRPNLVYSVLPRPASSNAASQTIVDWILANHRGQSGIVYCLSKKDTENMAQALNQLSNSVIRAAVYHADLDDGAKTNVHMRWRENKIQVVCATIAFGMGIDKPDVRFVIHACISKSIEGLYQESGRAGRDGKDADCVLFYRSQDATRISSLVAGEPTGAEKIRAVLEYVQSERCRKIIFGEYFADTSGGQEKCGRCDNCVNPQTVRDLTYESWQVLKVAQDVHRGGGRLTLAQLADLARGLGGGRYTVSVIDDDTGANRKGKSSSGGGHIDLSTVSGGKVDLVKEDCEKLVVGLLVKGFLQDDYHYTAYAVNVYVQPGPQAIRLTRLTKAQAQTTKNLVKIAIPESRKGGSKPRASNADKSTTSSKVAEPSSATAKGKNRVIDDIDIDLDLEDIFDDVDDDDDVVIAPTRQAARQIHVSDEEDDNLDAFLDDDEDGDELEALLDAEADRRFGEVMHDEDDDDDEIDETNEEFRTSKRPRREEVVELDDEPMVPPIRHRPAAVPTPRAATSTNAPAAQRMATTSRPSPNGAPASGSDSGLRKRFRPYIPSAPSSSGSSSATLHRGTLASSSAGDHDADEDESLFAGIDLDMADEDGWQFNSVGTPRLGGRANFR